MRSGIASILLTLLAAMIATPIARAQDASATQPSDRDAGQVVIIGLKGQIDQFSRDALFRRFEQARATGAKNIILDLDTYGGLVMSGTEISRFLKRQDDVHIVAYVKDKAISAGAMIAVACDEIVMGPSAVLGDCAPIVFKQDGTLDPLPAAERGKAESPVVAEFEDSARHNHYDPQLLIAMVSVERVLHYVQDEEGNKKFVDAKTYADLIATGQWKPVPGVKDPVDDAGSLLTVHTPEAIVLGLAKGQSASAQALASERGWNVVADLSPGWGDGVVEFLSHPLVRMIMLTIFLQSLYIAMHTPGHGAAEAISLLSLSLLLGIPLLTGYAQWWEIVMIFAGLALIAFEVFVFPGHGVSIVIGAVLLIVGLIMTFVGNVGSIPGAWKMPATWRGLENGLFVVLGGLICSLLLSVWLRKYLPKIPYFNRLILTSTVDGVTMLAGEETETSAPPIGSAGHAVTDLRPSGSADFAGRVISVTSDVGFIKTGSNIIVHDVRDNRVIVRAATA